jgi:hypothetical protein
MCWEKDCVIFHFGQKLYLTELHLSPHHTIDPMSLLNKFKAGAQKAGMQATAFGQKAGTTIASGSRDLVQGFSLPGEAEKAAKILDSFLGRFQAKINAYRAS